MYADLGVKPTSRSEPPGEPHALGPRLGTGHGEIYDARQELTQPAWDAAPLTAYPPGTWSAARLMAPRAGTLFPQLMPPIRAKQTLRPVRPPARLADGSLAFDFGANLAGFTTLSFDPRLASASDASGATEAPQALLLRLTHAEIEDAAGTPDNVYFPGMEKTLPGGPSATCSMPDWYAHKWYECASRPIRGSSPPRRADGRPICRPRVRAPQHGDRPVHCVRACAARLAARHVHAHLHLPRLPLRAPPRERPARGRGRGAAPAGAREVLPVGRHGRGAGGALRPASDRQRPLRTRGGRGRSRAPAGGADARGDLQRDAPLARVAAVVDPNARHEQRSNPLD